MIHNMLDRYRDRIEAQIKDSIQDLSFFMNDEILTDMRTRTIKMTTAGKIVRGSLILLMHDIYDGENPEAAEKAAAAIEIIHTALLAHDDIIDRDEKRRGQSSLHHQFANLARNNDLDDPQHTGTSMAITAGDIGFFLGFKILSSMDVSENQQNTITEIFADEFLRVGIAGSEDLVLGASAKEPSKDEILDLYRNKTARYTFSLPLMTGAILGNADDEEIKKLETIGEKLGIIYQLKDDELDLFGDEQTTGKDKASDIKENKKTLHRRTALTLLDKEQEQRIRNHLNNATNIEEILKQFKELPVTESVQKTMEELHSKAINDIENLSLNKDDTQALKSLARFCLERDY